MQNFTKIAKKIVRENKAAYLRSFAFVILLTAVQALRPPAFGSCHNGD